jgi:FkbM family methyltransferase
MVTIKEFEDIYEIYMCGNVNIISDCLKKGDTLVDIGANTGLLATKIIERVELGKLILVEPIKPYYEECKNKLGHLPNVEFENVGFSDKNGVEKFYCSEINLGYNKIYRDDMEIHPHFIEEINCVKFSDWVGDRKIDFIKIDAEGHDTLIIEGMLDWLDKIDKVPYILFEGDWYDEIEKNTVKMLMERYPYDVNYVGRDILMIPKIKNKTII